MKPFIVTAIVGATASADSAQDVTIKVAMHYTDEQAAPLLACFDRYEKAKPSNANTYQQLGYRDYLQTVLTSRIAGESPVVSNVYSIWSQRPQCHQRRCH